MTPLSENVNAGRTQNVYRAGRRGAAWSSTESSRAQSGTLATARKVVTPSKPLRLDAPKKAN